MQLSVAGGPSFGMGVRTPVKAFGVWAVQERKLSDHNMDTYVYIYI